MSSDLSLSGISRQLSSAPSAPAPARTATSESPAAKGAPDLAHIARAAQDAAAKIPLPKPAQINFNPEHDRKRLQEAVSMLNQQIDVTRQGLGFTIDEKLNRPIVTVRNIATGEVVRQIPNEVVVQMAHHLENLKGLLHNDTA